MHKPIIILMFVIMAACQSTQRPDNAFDVSVASPAFASGKNEVLIDEAHHNMHTMSGTYQPFSNLLQNDGLRNYPGKRTITRAQLDSIDIYVIANAKGGEHDFKERPAFTPQECSIIGSWVKQGGSLLLIADHYPFVSASAKLAEVFGVHMFGGETTDTVNAMGSAHDKLIFTHENGLLSDHPITHDLRTIISDRGQSLSTPPNAIVLLKLSEYAQHSLPDSVWTEGSTTYTSFSDPISAAANCQGLAMVYGAGRVVILGEAAMITAQIYEGEKFGMNTIGNDNKQFASNVLRWLGRKL